MIYREDYDVNCCTYDMLKKTSNLSIGGCFICYAYKPIVWRQHDHWVTSCKVGHLICQLTHKISDIICDIGERKTFKNILFINLNCISILSYLRSHNYIDELQFKPVECVQAFLGLLLTGLVYNLQWFKIYILNVYSKTKQIF